MQQDSKLRQPPLGAEAALIVDLIRTNQAHTRAQLCRKSGLGRNVIAGHLATAVESGLVRQSGTAPSNGGRSPYMWEFAGEAGTVLTASIAVHSFHITRSDLNGSILEEAMQQWEIQTGPVETLKQVCQSLHKFKADATAPIWGIGVSLPGPIDHKSGKPVSPPIMKGWDGFDVRSFFNREFHVPVLVDNDVNAMALGHASTTSDPDSIYVLVSTGIGAGLISQGKLHRGAQGAAGDIGHTRINGYDDVVCRCGRIGCLEAIAGGWALERSAIRLASSGLSPYLSEKLRTNGRITVDDVAFGTNAGDTGCIELVAMAAKHIGGVLAVMVSFYNPNRIVLAGPIPHNCPLFLDTVQRTIQERALTLATSDLVIEIAAHPRTDESLGCAHMVVDEAFADTALTGEGH